MQHTFGGPRLVGSFNPEEVEAVPQPKTFEIKTTAQVERTYHVQATDADQAHKRLRSFLADPDAVREGVVVKLDADRNATPEQKAPKSEITEVDYQKDASVTELGATKAPEPKTPRAARAS
jgi:hypothetical protein